ncbi:ubiquitin-like-specific protease 1D [Impatiens glandulifera]|uniref:ubiquitin-like-specific protease 1D n=1 Tax=Impatiens glandulifera TaxID=253017 RepID=UPI001FB0F5BC|nr:ubiquitin-like-specific protease 1D [Impatiens glandulifera]
MDMKQYSRKGKKPKICNDSSADISVTADQISKLQPVSPEKVLLQNENLKEEETLDDVLVTQSSPSVPCSSRLKRRINRTSAAITHTNAGFHEIGIVEDASSQQLVSTSSTVPQKSECKEKEEDMADDIICLGSEQQLARRFRRTKVITQGKLDTETFECYFANLWGKFTVEKTDSFAYLDCLWFSSYMEGYEESVLSWIKKKKIFSKRYVIIPIILWGHWNLLILCHLDVRITCKIRTPCMLLLDSLQTNNPRRLEPGIRKFVLDLYNMEKRSRTKKQISQIPLLVPKVPQQKNGKDCGKYVLYYINLFLENAPENFSVSKGYPYFLKEDWFPDEAVEHFCEGLVSSPSVPSTAINLDVVGE